MSSVKFRQSALLRTTVMVSVFEIPWQFMGSQADSEGYRTHVKSLPSRRHHIPLSASAWPYSQCVRRQVCLGLTTQAVSGASCSTLNLCQPGPVGNDTVVPGRSPGTTLFCSERYRRDRSHWDRSKPTWRRTVLPDEIGIWNQHWLFRRRPLGNPIVTVLRNTIETEKTAVI